MKQLRNVSWLLVLVSILIFASGCGRVVPPGSTVVILKPRGEPIIKSEGIFRALGRDKVYIVDEKLKSYPKKLNVLCSDDINMSVNMKWIGSFQVTANTIDVLKKKIPSTPSNEGGITGRISLDQFFKTAMEDMLSATARDIISPYKTDNIREKREEIQQAVKQKFVARMQELKYPVNTADVLITNLDYPKSVTEMRNKIKQADLQDLENAAIAKAAVAKAKRDAELEAERGKAMLVKAEADAAANKIRAASLTPEILAVKKLETLVKLAEGPNNNTVIIPFEGLQGGMANTMLTREALDRLNATLIKVEKKK
jgi:regulator of protease activity HflC (stomatin/prohibitin superfamily)